MDNTLTDCLRAITASTVIFYVTFRRFRQRGRYFSNHAPKGKSVENVRLFACSGSG
jgi:hypothetical protein